MWHHKILICFGIFPFQLNYPPILHPLWCSQSLFINASVEFWSTRGISLYSQNISDTISVISSKETPFNLQSFTINEFFCQLFFLYNCFGFFILFHLPFKTRSPTTSIPINLGLYKNLEQIWGISSPKPISIFWFTLVLGLARTCPVKVMKKKNHPTFGAFLNLGDQNRCTWCIRCTKFTRWDITKTSGANTSDLTQKRWSFLGG